MAKRKLATSRSSVADVIAEIVLSSAHIIPFIIPSRNVVILLWTIVAEVARGGGGLGYGIVLSW